MYILSTGPRRQKIETKLRGKEDKYLQKEEITNGDRKEEKMGIGPIRKPLRLGRNVQHHVEQRLKVTSPLIGLLVGLHGGGHFGLKLVDLGFQSPYLVELLLTTLS